MQELDEELINPGDTESISFLRSLVLVWRYPNRVFKSISQNPSLTAAISLSIASAFVSAVNRSTTFWFFIAGRSEYFNVFELVKNFGLYLAIFFVMVTLIKWTGTWLGGEADWTVQASVYAYSNIPTLLVLLLFIPNVISFFLIRNGNATTEIIHESAFGVLLTVVKYLRNGLVIWSFILHLISISIVQKFSHLRALSNFLLAAFFISVPLLMLLYLRLL